MDMEAVLREIELLADEFPLALVLEGDTYESLVLDLEITEVAIA